MVAITVPQFIIPCCLFEIWEVWDVSAASSIWFSVGWKACLSFHTQFLDSSECASSTLDFSYFSISWFPLKYIANTYRIIRNSAEEHVCAFSSTIVMRILVVKFIKISCGRCNISSRVSFTTAEEDGATWWRKQRVQVKKRKQKGKKTRESVTTKSLQRVRRTWNIQKIRIESFLINPHKFDVFICAVTVASLVRRTHVARVGFKSCDFSVSSFVH